MINSFKFFKYCNNCGKNGHTFYQCKYHITSIGVIVYKKEFNKGNSNIKYLMISRKDSLGYVELIRGKYPLYNKLYLQNIIDVMTNDEKKRILTEPFDKLYSILWCENDNEVIKYKNETIIASEKFNKLKEGFINDNTIYSLKSLVEESKTSWNSCEWGFPKGRRNTYEKDLSCALREFEEETGYKEDSIKVINNLLPIEEIFIGSNFKSYKHCYYIGCMDNNEIPFGKFQETEVGEMGWYSYDEALQLIRPYNKEKIDVLKKVNTIISSYEIL